MRSKIFLLLALVAAAIASYVLSGGVAVIPPLTAPVVGQSSRGVKLTSIRLQGEALTIDADVTGQALILATASAVVNNGLLEATNGATLDIRSNVNQGTSQFSSFAGSIEAHGNSTVELEAVTITSGKILIDAGSTLEIENGKTTLTGVDVVNHGNTQIDAAAVSATLVLGEGSSIGGDITIGSTGEY